MASYNLISEKWIPCIMPGGITKSFGLQEILINAHEIKEINDSSPLVTIALHRLLLAILHRNFGPETLKIWTCLWQAKKWDESKLADYFNKCHGSFDLFDKEKPFYQVPVIVGTDKRPVQQLVMEISSGNDVTLFDHNMDDSPVTISPAAAARYAVAIQAFVIGFGKSKPFYFSDGPLTRGLILIASGGNLFETLALNLIEYNNHKPFQHAGEDLPIWEQKVLAIPDQNGTPIKGYLDYLTWQSRRLHFFSEGNPPVIRYCQIQQNLKLPKSRYLDPFKCYGSDKEKGFIPRSIKPDKAVWRDSHILFQTIDKSYKRPELFNWLAQIDNKRYAGEIEAQPSYNLMLTGIATQKGSAAAILLWRQERMPLPLVYLYDQELEARLNDALTISEEVGNLFTLSFIEVRSKAMKLRVPSPLHILAQEVFPKNQDGRVDMVSVQKFIESLSADMPYWAHLGISFRELITRLTDDESVKKLSTFKWWTAEVRKAAILAFKEATDSLNRSSRWLKGVTIARNAFRRHMNNILEQYIDAEQEGGEA